MLFFAYDGTINGDWVSDYAVRLAAHHSQRRLQLVHVDERRLDHVELDRRVERIAAKCERLSVELHVDVRNLSRTVFATLAGAIPTGSDSFLVCGTRIRGRSRGYLKGSVGERFLTTRKSNVLVLRVIRPGQLGVPRNVLAPVSGHPGSFASGVPFLRLLAPDIGHVHVLHVVRIGHWRLRRLAPDEIERLRSAGIDYCQRVERETIGAGGLGDVRLDAHATVSDDVPRDICNFAARLKAELIYLGASEQNWMQRLLLGNPLERVFRNAPCDVGVYRGIV